MEIDAEEPEGNAVMIMSRVYELLKAADRFDEWPAISAEMKSGDYDNLCDVAERVTNGSITVINR